MRTYRCFLLMHSAFAGVEIFDAETDAEAEDRAEVLVRDRAPRFNGYDLWDGTRRVQRVLEIQREMNDTRERIRRWRMKAEELRTAADDFTNNSSRGYFQHAAEAYEALANGAEGRFERRKEAESDAG